MLLGNYLTLVQVKNSEPNNYSSESKKVFEFKCLITKSVKVDALAHD